MALNVNPNAQLVFFEHVFGPSHKVTQQVKLLIADGAKIEVGLFTCSATLNGVTKTVNLTKGSSALMKPGSLDQVYVAQNKALIEKWVQDLSSIEYLSQVHSTPAPEVIPVYSVVLNGIADKKFIFVIKQIRTVTGLDLKEAKDLAEIAKDGGHAAILNMQSLDTAKAALAGLVAAGAGGYIKNLSTGEVVAISGPGDIQAESTVSKLFTSQAPVPHVIKLREAQALGQKVNGTSKGSVYRCIALNDRIRLAARIMKGGTISIRAEWSTEPTLKEKQALQDVGMSMKADYASIHLDSSGVPPGRVIGAFVTGSDIQWQQAVINAADLVVDE